MLDLGVYSWCRVLEGLLTKLRPSCWSRRTQGPAKEHVIMS